MLYYLAGLFKVNFTLGECLIFGALISPTDAIAVLGTFKSIKNPPQRLKTLITGEGLFNDAGAILMLVILSQVVYKHVHLTIGDVAESLMLETGGGILWGTTLGVLTGWLIKRCKSPEVATMLTIAASSCGFVIANHIHVSGVITMVVAGLIIGGYSKKEHFPTETTLVLNNFWELINEILNGFLFVLIGLAMLNIHVDNSAITIGLTCIIIVFIARLLSILVPDFLLSKILRRQSSFSSSKSTLLAWGGIRGGLSIALALSIDGFPDSLVAITYVVVLSSILIQGGTFKWALSKLAKE
jgi:CPA1 family monovalent cation:H+ antiporter